MKTKNSDNNQPDIQVAPIVQVRLSGPDLKAGCGSRMADLSNLHHPEFLPRGTD